MEVSVRPGRSEKGSYHAQVRLDNKEPISHRPLTAFYFDVDLEVARETAR